MFLRSHTPHRLFAWRVRFYLCCLVLSLAGPDGVPFGRASEPIEELKAFSDFDDVNLEKLAGGNILAKRGELADFPRGISVQTCYVVMAPMELTLYMLKTWDPSPHKSLKLDIHCPIPSSPAAEDFAALDFSSGKIAVRWLVEKTLSTRAEKTELQISAAEAAGMAEWVRNEREADPDHARTRAPEIARQCWINILQSRAEKFYQEGFAGLPPYENGKETIKPAAEFEGLLEDQPRITRQFAAIIAETPMARQQGADKLEPYCYWELFDVTSHATLNLGALYVKPVGDGYQLLDCQHYASGGYYASLILQQVWPIRIGDRDGCLVWRGDFLSAPSLAITKGIERVAYGKIMLLETRKSIAFFLEDLLAESHKPQ